MKIKPSANQIKDKSVQSDTQRRQTDRPVHTLTAEWVTIIPPEDNPVFQWDDSIR